MRVLPIMVGSGRGQGQKHALPEVSVKGGQGEAKGYTKGGAKEAKEGGKMKSERLRYNRIVLRLFSHYQDYLAYRKPRKCKMMKVIRHWSDQYRYEVTEVSK